MDLPTAFLALLGIALVGVVVVGVAYVIGRSVSGREAADGDAPGGRESPIWTGAGPTGYGRGAGTESIEASGLAVHKRHRPRKRRLHN
jgi:hypothetical protein